MKPFTLFGILAAILCSFTGQAQPSPEFQLSTHILDITRGKPAAGVTVSLWKYNPQTLDWDFADKAPTGENGRIDNFLPADKDNYGAYKLRFETEGYFTGHFENSIYPYIEVCFYLTDSGHYHIPVTVSANGYSTYRGG